MHTHANTLLRTHTGTFTPTQIHVHVHTHTHLGSSTAIFTEANFSPGVLRTCQRQKIDAAHFCPLDNILLSKKLGERRGRVKVVTEYQNL